MKQYLSLLLLSTALFVTAGCGSKKQIKTTPTEQQNFVQEEQSVDTTAQDKKEDYAITA